MRLPRSRRNVKEWKEETIALNTSIAARVTSIKTLAAGIVDTIDDNTLTQPPNYGDLVNEL